MIRLIVGGIMPAFWVIALALSTPTPAQAVTPPETCTLLQKAYRISTGEGHDTDLSTVGLAKTDPSPLAKYRPEFRSYTGLTPGEFADLEAHEAAAVSPGFVPQCAWDKDDSVGEKSGYAVAFSAPILSTDRRIALVEVSYSKGISAHGGLCIMRLSPAGWNGRCINAWSIR
ncbi:hypothetical protein AVM11_17425 [Sphingomonas melonis TY]|jgi:hypothetical protein|nr:MULTISPECIES: hypothetical protein [Sphingomonas]ANC88404.1 hypothetical protein A7E77_10285 [Sphingomonas sp. NIC1]AOW25487.1 hypothetical protein BJP26_06205 [Sphingomonas melonis TY]ATI57449.1 hypothetical protein CP552_13425 [Sphingomonas melonis]KZB95121.1 hypothetical protein AVM11_17425 [Sphingomonas melonis TY]MBI0530210.1 hypothetical protein [Sphingomonas sp. TX0522]